MKLVQILLTCSLAGNFACSGVKSVADSKAPKVTEKKAAPKIQYHKGYNYGQLNESSDNVSRYLAGEFVPSKIVFKEDAQALAELELPVLKRSAAYEVLLIPVGYQENLPQIDGLTSNLKIIFQDLNLNFSSLDRSVPVGIKRIDYYATLINKNSAKTIKEKVQADKLAFILNTDQYMGSGGEHFLFTGNNEDALFLITHEMGHSLGLEDGYKRYYQKINHSELFTSLKKLEPLVWEAYQKIKPPIYFTGNNWNGEIVFSFYPPENDIMDKYYTKQELLESIAAGKSPFNPLQREIMRLYIKKNQNLVTTPRPLSAPHQP